MNRHTRTARTLSRLALCAALAATASSASAQQNYGRQGNGRQNFGNGNSSNGGTLELPDGVRRVVGIDAQNVLLAELEPEMEGGPSQYRAIPVKHVYVGGIAKALGGSTISTEEFVSPAYSKNGGFGGINPQGNFGGAQGFGQNGFNNGYGLGNGFNGGYPNGYGNGFNGGVNPGSYLIPNGAIAGVNPGFYPGNVPGINGGVGAPIVTYGVGNLIRSRQIKNPNGGTVTTQESR